MRRALFAICLAAAMPLRAGLGPEIAMPLLPPQPAIVWAPGDYTPNPLARPSVAPLGDGFVVAWFDGMSERVQLVGRDGTRASDNGTALATLVFDGSVLYPPVVASRGDSAAVAFAVSESVYVRIVRADGTIGPAQQAATHGLPFLAATGDGYLLVLISNNGAAGQFLDAAGKPVGTKFTIDPQLTYFAAVASNGSGSLVVTRSFDRVKTWLVLPGGGVAPAAVFTAFQPADPAVVWDGSQYVVAWSETDGAHVGAVASDGSLRAMPRLVASGAVRDVVSSGNGATLVTQPPQFVRFAQGTTVAIASGSLDLPEAGAAAQNGDAVLVAGAQRLDGVIAGSAPFAIAFAPIVQNTPRVASGASLSVVTWSEGVASSYVTRLARFTPDGVLDVIDLPAVPMVLDASGFRVAIATIENGAIALRAVDPQGNLWPAEVLVPRTASSTFRTLVAVVITPATTAVVWYDTTPQATTSSLHVSFERGPTIDVGTIDFSPGSVAATWDGNAVVVAAPLHGQLIAKGVAAGGVRWTRALSIDSATSFVAIASNRAGRTIVARSRDLAVLDGNGALVRTVRMTDQITGSAAFDGSAFTFATFTHLLRFDADGQKIGSDDLRTPDWFGVAVAPAAIAYTRGSRVYIRTR